MVTSVPLADLKDVLMEPKAKGLKNPYFVIHSPNTGENITVLLSGNNGFEFNKTIGYFHKSSQFIQIRCVYGKGVVMIQRNNESGDAKEVRVVALKPGVEVEIPSGYGHFIANTGKTFLITVDNSPLQEKLKDYDTIKEKHGLAYYIIDKKGEIGFERNPNYHFHPQLTTN